MIEVPLTRGFVALIDEADEPTVAGRRWAATIMGKHVYAAHFFREAGCRRQLSIPMHRLITGAPKGMVVDHINGDGLDNRRSNLRVCTNAENLRNRGPNATNTSGYKGVVTRAGRFEALLHVDGRQFRGGSFKTAEEAARRYDELAVEHHGAFARLNFPLAEQVAA